ncbi:MAG: hypothetical protein H6555_08215 [Lewinellaceae bacterium]|nr:hypothetical protein [Lewinellaceae bacterium]
MHHPDFRLLLHPRTVLLATKHGKESSIAPVLETAFSWTIATPPDFDTDQFGTFTGEIDRGDDPLAAARSKALAALEHYPAYTAVIASEGSFGPHPEIPFVASDHELLYFYDRTSALEVHASLLSTQTNYRQQKITDWTALIDLAREVSFPGHRLILRGKSAGQPDQLIKGIGDYPDLEHAYRQFSAAALDIWAETDMRAMYNPTRQTVIRQAAERLVAKLKSPCPACQRPGFDVVRYDEGLPCLWCHSPTRLIQTYYWGCPGCGHEEARPRQDGLTMADPGYCDACNP